MLILLLLAACSAGEDEVGQGSEPSVADIVATPTLPDATNTYIPIVEAEATPTATPTLTPAPTETPSATPTPSPTPLSPIAGVTVEPYLPTGLQKPTVITHAFDDRLFVVEQAGRIRIVRDGVLEPTPFLDIVHLIGSDSSEQGLLGLAFHPDYATAGAAGEGQFYVNYTDKEGDTHISRFSASANNPDQADPQSEIEYLFVDQPYPNHNGGILAFGPDGYLYVGLGDGGSANDPLNAGQSRTTLLGKILRLDVDSEADRYAIPPDNPFVGATDALPEIWAYGLRNPWRFSFDRATGDLYIADVGQSAWEEVSFQPAGSAGGENYGWRIMEGLHCFQAETCDQAGLALPVFEYDHSQGCSITGGYVYRGQVHPEMTGNYFVADYCTGIIWRLFPEGERWRADLVHDSALVISTFGEDVNGELFLTDYARGAIYRLVPGPAPTN